MSSAQALTYIEIDVDRCANDYGVSPCTASIPTTGSRKCFRSLGSCQDRDNFDNDPVTIRFAVDASYLPKDIECIPCLTDVDFSPSIVSLGVDLGQRASIKITCKDHPDSDTGPHGDPYLSDRDYNPFARGTFFGKFVARNPYLRGRNLRLIRGTVGQALADMETRHFIIESFDGPRPDGSFSITAKDVLKLADGDRAQAPVLSNGFLQSGIDNNDMALTLSPAGIGNAEYPASGTAQIGGKEIVTFTRSGDAITITARAQYNTTAVAHSAQDRFQLCKVYTSADVADIISDLLVNYASVDPDFIPIGDWQTETATYLQLLYTACIAEPTAVSDLLKELIEQAALALAWDDEGQVIRLQVLRGILTDTQQFTADNYVVGTLDTKEQPERRITRVWTYFGLINPLEPIDEPNNYRSSAEAYDPLIELNHGAIALKKIYSRWISERAVADRLNAILIARYKRPPRRISLDLWRDGQYQPRILDGADVEARGVQDDTGAVLPMPAQITRVNPQPDRFKLELEEIYFDVPEGFDDRVVTIDVSRYDFNFRDAYDVQYPEPETGDEVTVRIYAGAIVGSTSTATPAFDVGDWPTEAATGNRTSGSPILSSLSVDPIAAGWTSGMTVAGTGIPSKAKILSVDSPSQITLDKNATSGSGTSTSLTIYTVLLKMELHGRVQGKGGNGGTGGRSGTPGVAGGAGGTALYTRYPIAIEEDGEIWGGGGGGGGSSGSPGPGGVFVNGLRGAGGQGYQPGVGGGTPATTETRGIGANANYTGQAGHGGVEGGNGTAGQSFPGGSGGGAGGAGGSAIDGDSFVTEVGSPDVQGSRVN
jgi:hypothetical protein